MQLWDTAGQERFRSISKLYYRGAAAIILVYNITDEESFTEMGRWLAEVKTQLGIATTKARGRAEDADTDDDGDEGVIVHVVGTKSDIVAQDPSARRVSFERCIAYVAAQLQPHLASTPPPTAGISLTNDNPFFPPISQPQQKSRSSHSRSSSTITVAPPASSLMSRANSTGTMVSARSHRSKRSYSFWGNDAGWDVCHEISASEGEGVEEVFRVVTSRIVERELRRRRRAERAAAAAAENIAKGGLPGAGVGKEGVAEGEGWNKTLRRASASFRLGPRMRRGSFLGLGPQVEEEDDGSWKERKERKGGCC